MKINQGYNNSRYTKILHLHIIKGLWFIIFIFLFFKIWCPFLFFILICNSYHVTYVIHGLFFINHISFQSKYIMDVRIFIIIFYSVVPTFISSIFIFISCTTWVCQCITLWYWVDKGGFKTPPIISYSIVYLLLIDTKIILNFIKYGYLLAWEYNLYYIILEASDIFLLSYILTHHIW